MIICQYISLKKFLILIICKIKLEECGRVRVEECGRKWKNVETSGKRWRMMSLEEGSYVAFETSRGEDFLY